MLPSDIAAAGRFPRLAVALVKAGVHQVLHAELIRAAAADVDGPRAAAAGGFSPGAPAAAGEGPVDRETLEGRAAWSAALTTVNAENGGPVETAGGDNPWDLARQSATERM